MISRSWIANFVLSIPVATVLLLGCMVTAHGQVAPCPDPVPQTAGTHRFRGAGDTFNIPINVGDCLPVALDLRWSNGANNGSNFIVTFFDANSQPIYSKLIWGFMTGNHQFPFTMLEWLGSASMMAVPATVTIQAVQPFAFPSSISYRVTRASRHPKRKLEGIDTKLAMDLRSAPGKLMTEGRSSKSINYRLEEVAFDEPREIERKGKKETIERVYRLALRGGELSNVGLVWIDDAALACFWSSDRQSLVTLIYDASILRDGAEIAVSPADGSQLQRLEERLKLPPAFKALDGGSGEGNSIVRIKSAVRSIGASRQPLVQLELRTTRPFPARESPLQLQVGKKFFLNELTGDYTGRTLTLTVTPEMFAEIRDGSEIVAFFDRPDRSGAPAQDIWYFGRLNKSMLER